MPSRKPSSTQWSSSDKSSSSTSRSQPNASKAKPGPTATDELELRIDADFYAYRSAQVNEEELDWGEDLICIYSDLKRVTRTFKEQIDAIQSRFDTDNVTLYFSDTKNFRKGVDPEYKGNRTKRKPVGYVKLLQWCTDNYRTVRVKNVEADDALGMDCHLSPEEFILVSPDKDMKQISCRHFNNEEEFYVGPDEADLFFWTQCLTGDAVDGYKGVPGVGAVKAKSILSKVKNGDYWSTIVAAYEKAGLSEEDAVRNARLARILRPGEYNSTIKEPVLWTPPQSQSLPQ